MLRKRGKLPLNLKRQSNIVIVMGTTRKKTKNKIPQKRKINYYVLSSFHNLAKKHAQIKPKSTRF